MVKPSLSTAAVLRERNVVGFQRGREPCAHFVVAIEDDLLSDTHAEHVAEKLPASLYILGQEVDVVESSRRNSVRAVTLGLVFESGLMLSLRDVAIRLIVNLDTVSVRRKEAKCRPVTIFVRYPFAFDAMAHEADRHLRKALGAFGPEGN